MAHLYWVTLTPLQYRQSVRGQLPLCAQKVALQTIGSCANQGDHSTVPLEGHFPSNLYRWCDSSNTYIHL